MTISRIREVGTIDTAPLIKGFKVENPELDKLLQDIVERLNLVLQSVEISDIRYQPQTRIRITDYNISWTKADIFVKTLVAGANAFNFYNPQQGKAVMLELTPVSGSTLSLPSTCKIITGTFDDSKTNYVAVLCIDAKTPQYVATINQEIT